MPLKIKSTSGSVTLSAENAAGDNTLTIPNLSGSNSVISTGDTATVTETMVHADAVNAFKSGRKNLFINGGFDVWQRGTSLAGGTSYLADRWYNATTETQSRQTFTPGQTDVDGFPTYYHRGAGGSTEWYEVKQKIENVGVTGGREVTLSYWMKGSSAFTNAPYRAQDFGSGGSGGVSAALSTASITTSWAKYTHTFTFPSISGKTVGANNFTQIHLIRANVNNVTIDLANCQLEFGPTATDFEYRSYAEELALCQRYYQRTQAASDNYKHFGLHFSAADVGGTVYGTAAIPLVTTMRVIPTLVTTGTVSNYSVYAKNANHPCTAISIDTGIDDGTISGNFYINAATGSGNAAGTAGALRANNTASAFIALDAEL
jgi:hypothetical protein